MTATSALRIEKDFVTLVMQPVLQFVGREKLLESHHCSLRPCSYQGKSPSLAHIKNIWL